MCGQITLVVTVAIDSIWSAMAWVTVKPVGSAKSCRPKVNSGYKDATSANGSEERTGEMLRAMRRCDGYVAFAGDGILTMITESTKGTFMPPVLAEGTWLKPTTFDSGEPYLGLILSNRRVRKVLTPFFLHYVGSLLSSIFLHDETDCTLLPTTGCIPQFIDLFGICWQCSLGTLAFTSYVIATDGSGSGFGPGVPCAAHPMCDVRRYRSLFPRRRVAPPTPPPPSPPPSEEEPSAEMYDPAAELVGDPDEPYVAELVPYGAPEAYYSDTSYGSERDSSGSVSLGYGSASSGSASDGASDDDLVNRYFAGTFPPP
ncbi:hypothetical protein PIB30_033225 [Stylosanthes scabra]|uniref:Uncharacterized protein n=1 Tax=Stylosanthes scabra TaxID=79078 RepID=A0ABU6UB65_9FABA|nr:hypothetical protein [Stylosanthes scabra]